MDYLKMDSHLLVSILNTKLRNDYDSLENLCDDLSIDCGSLLEKINLANYKYDEKLNQIK